MLLVFFVLCVSGVLSYFTEYNRKIAIVHTVFGAVFSMAAVVHMINNVKALKLYSKSWIMLALFTLTSAIGYMAITESYLMNQFINYGARSKASIGIQEGPRLYTEIILDLDKKVQLSFELKKAKHFWHPQIAIWTEDKKGNYLETLYVTKATAKGVFSGGRTKENFKSMDTRIVNEVEGHRRVNALPVWSHQRAVVYEDGLLVPTVDKPLPDGISGATPKDNFVLKSSVDYVQDFVIKFEINVAFDDNEFYSEYDFAADEVFHNGTGQLGQPSLIYSSTIDISNKEKYTIMRLEGHGHHSAQNGIIYEDLSKITTALEVVEYIVVGLK